MTADQEYKTLRTELSSFGRYIFLQGSRENIYIKKEVYILKNHLSTNTISTHFTAKGVTEKDNKLAGLAKLL